MMEVGAGRKEFERAVGQLRVLLKRDPGTFVVCSFVLCPRCPCALWQHAMQACMSACVQVSRVDAC